MNQSISNAFCIAAAESAINDHRLSVHGCDVERTRHCTEEEATEQLQSLALWAEVNEYCLRLQKPVYI